MTIDEAIEELKGLPGPAFIIEGETAWEAAQLGIEALKRIKQSRESLPTVTLPLLPGETKD